MLIALDLARRYWKLAVIGLALMFAGVMYVGKLRAERSLEKARGQLALANGAIERNNASVRAMERETARRAAAQADLLRDARRENEASVSQIERLRRSSVVPRTGPCTISEALREAEDRL